MPDYSKSKIYSIRSHQTDLIYIGSTIQTLALRLAGHVRDFKKFKNGKCNYITSFDMLKFEDYYIELICEFPCASKLHLSKKEGEYIRSSKCVNKNIAGRTSNQYYLDNKVKIKKYAKQYQLDNKEKRIKYRLDNKEKISKQQKQYQLDNKVKIAKHQKQYHLDNKVKIKIYQMKHKEKIKKYKKQYYLNNAEKISEKRKQYYLNNVERLRISIECKCGGKYQHDAKARHFRTKKHLKYISTLT